ncbi:MAG TPA: 4Fe-4S dicluster domain-containing protein [Gammaproteobacteria bacterium]|nr:4Fe-4S dicluster domain-containing protein [Gammaproteobacteria bacterium]
MTSESEKGGKRRLTPREQKQRREFLRSVVLAGGVVATSLLGFVPVVSSKQLRLRPPGALAEREFLAACIKCGQCEQVCPVEAIHLADLTDGFGVGVPFIDARAQACDFSCDGLQCVLACPTGALSHELDYPHQTRMGFARLARPKACLAVQGKGFKGLARGASFDGKLRYDEIDRWNPLYVRDHPYDLEICDLCVRQCPIQIRIGQCEAGTPPSGDENQCPPRPAIHLEAIEDGSGTVRMKPVVLDGCVGCGVCEMICPAEDGPAIVVDARKTAEEATA